MKEPLVSRAWLRHGPKGMFGRTEPGLLIGQEGKVGFVTKNGVVFVADRTALRVNWPWWEFGGGVHINTAGEIYRLSLVRPPEGEDIELGDRSPMASALAQSDFTGISSIGEGLASGEAWKTYLAAETSAPTT